MRNPREAGASVSLAGDAEASTLEALGAQIEKIRPFPWRRVKVLGSADGSRWCWAVLFQDDGRDWAVPLSDFYTSAARALVSAFIFHRSTGLPVDESEIDPALRAEFRRWNQDCLQALFERLEI